MYKINTSEINDIYLFLKNHIDYKNFEELKNGDQLTFYYNLCWYNLGEIKKDDTYIYFNTTSIKGKIHKEDYNKLYKYMEIGKINIYDLFLLYDKWDTIQYNKRCNILRRNKLYKSCFDGIITNKY